MTIKNRGFALLELLIAMFIVAVAILGVVRLQVLAIQNSNQAYWYSMATEQVESLAELLRASNFTPTMQQVIAWQQHLATVLPAGQGVMTTSGNGYEITVSWLDRQRMANPHIAACKDDIARDRDCVAMLV